MDEPTTANIGMLRARIQSLISDSERLFLKFAEAYPTFVHEMRRSLDGSTHSLSSIGSGISLEDSMRALFDSISAILADSAKRFQAMHERDDILLSSLNRGIDTLAGLESVIARIKDDSIEMELISLNAMTVALKSGVAGKAFSVITDELKRLSTRTIALTELLTEDGRSLLNLFTRYRVDVQHLEKTQVSLFDGLDERIRLRFSSLETAVHEIGSALSDLVTWSRGVEKPVHAIMETVQLQDIVRQSLDHVLMALDELESSSSHGGNVDALDDLAFRKRLAELAESILSDVKLRFADARDTFRTESKEVNRIVADGEKRRRTILEESFGSGDSGLAARSFRETSEELADIESQISLYLKTKTAISSNGGRLSSAVEGLETRFHSFSKILNRFRTIDIASRIEVSKQAVLSSMDDTVIEMSALTERIGNDVDEALQSTRGFIEDTKSAISTYAETSEGEASLVSQTDWGLQEAHHRLSELNNSIKNGARDFTLFTQEFISMLEVSAQDVTALDAVLAEIDAASSDFASFRHAAEAELAKAGVGDRYDDVHSIRLKEIIDRFTIYAHKQVAADLGGFHVEETSDNAEALSGEVTFF